MTPSKESKDCPICNLPLGPLELDLNQDWHYDCNKCAICSSDVEMDRIRKCLKQEIDVTHSTCYDERMALEFKKRPVTITQELLDWHNERRLIFDVSMDLSVNSNQTMASTNFRNSRWVHEMKLEELYILMKRVEAIAAEASIMLTESKRKEAIRLEIHARDKKLVDSAVEGRISVERAKEIKRNKFTPKEKAINAMILVGLTREQAIESLNMQEIKKLMKEKGIDEITAKAELFPAVN